MSGPIIDFGPRLVLIGSYVHDAHPTMGSTIMQFRTGLRPVPLDETGWTELKRFPRLDGHNVRS